MVSNAYISLKKDCNAIAVPSGEDLTLFSGTEVRITQALGGNFTVMTHQGTMAVIPGKDAEALGEEVPPEAVETAASGPLNGDEIEKRVWKKLKTCYDPEIPHNIVDLGLVYGCKVTGEEGAGYTVEIQMTLTAPGCGMGEVLKKDAQLKISSIPGVKEAKVALVFDPPWNPGKMNPALRREFF